MISNDTLHFYLSKKNDRISIERIFIVINPARSIVITVLKKVLMLRKIIENVDCFNIGYCLEFRLYLLFVNAIRSSLPREKYSGRLNLFFDLSQYLNVLWKRYLTLLCKAQ